MSVIRNNRVENYINEICGFIKNKKVHDDVKEELLSHIEEIIDYKISEGKSEESAINEALKQMGAADIVGMQLNKVHKADPDWVLIAITTILILFGIFTLWVMTKNNALGGNSEIGYLFKSIEFLIIGSILALCTLKLDYRSLKKYSKYVYSGTIMMLIITLVIASPVNGIIGWIKIGPISFNIINIAPFLLVIALSGILDGWDWTTYKGVITGVLLVFIPIILFMYMPSVVNAMIYGVAGIILMKITGCKVKNIIILIGSVGSIVAMYVFSAEYRVIRAFSWVRPIDNPEGSGWIYNQLDMLRNSAVLIGKGGKFTTDMLPDINADFILSYILYNFGWLITMGLIIVISVFMVRVWKIGKNSKDLYGKLIVNSICTLFLLQFMINILMNITTFMPVFSVSLPFISYGGTGLVINILAIALISNIYKWRNTPYKKIEVKA